MFWQNLQNKQMKRQKNQNRVSLMTDSKMAQRQDECIIHPSNCIGRKFKRLSQIWDIIQYPKEIYSNWYKLDNTSKDSSSIVYVFMCQLCENTIEVREEGETLKTLTIIKCENLHNHKKTQTRQSLQMKKAAQQERIKLVQEIYLINKQTTIYSKFRKTNLNQGINSEDEYYNIHMSLNCDKTLGTSFVQYKILVQQNIVGENLIKFGLRSRKQLQIIGVLLVITDCYLNQINKVRIYCQKQVAQLLNRKLVEKYIQKMDINLKLKLKIIRNIQNRMNDVNYITKDSIQLMENIEEQNTNTMKQLSSLRNQKRMSLPEIQNGDNDLNIDLSV